MTRLVTIVLAVLCAASAVARADRIFPPSDCTKVTDEAQPEGEPPASWTDWSVEPAVGTQLLDPVDTVKQLLGDAMEAHHALTLSAQCDLVQLAAAYGYELVDFEPDPKTGHVVLRLAPRFVIRRVEIRGVPWYRPGIKEELARRLRLRVGEQLVYDKHKLDDQLFDEADRLRQYLQDDGFFEAVVTIQTEPSDTYGEILEVHVSLGDPYETGAIDVVPKDRPLPVTRSEIDDIFIHCRLHLFGECRWRQRFTRDQHQADIQTLVTTIQNRGYPAARVRSDFDQRTSFDRLTHRVDFQLRIDERRQLTVFFEGNKQADGNSPEGFSDDDLTKQLTFDSAASTDDLEVATSALALERYYQRAGYFDAAVSWARDVHRVTNGGQDQSIDVVTFSIDPGAQRTVRGVEIVGAKQVPESDIRGVIATRAASSSFSIIGGTASATREQLDADAAAVVQLYKSRGFLEAKVAVSAAPTEASLADPGIAAALLAAGTAPSDLYVRFTIDEGAPTVVDHVVVKFTGAHAASEADVRGQLGVADGAPFLLSDLQRAGNKVQDWYAHRGHPRALVTLDVGDQGDTHHLTATYQIDEREEVHVGKVVVRGNFRTSDWVVRQELGFDQGAVLTDDLYAAGVARLRATGLFSSIRVETPGLDASHGRNANVVVRVEEANDVRANLDFEGGYSDLKSVYTRIGATLPNPFHDGISLDASGTCGGLFHSPPWACPVTQALDGDIKFPRWVTRGALPASPDVSVSGFYHVQETQRFGTLTAYGGSLAASRVWSRDNAGGHAARSIGATLHYDFRHRNIEEDTVRIAGNAGSVTSSSLGNNAGSVGLDVTWDQRVDAHGSLNPLSPDHGFKLQAGASIASRFLLGQDDFVKVEGIGQWITQLTDRLQLKVEGRYDEGIPLGGAVLLPEVERFFAGGDDTVRGFPQDLLATEVIEEPLPPFGDIHQVKVLPAGGNIRMLGSVDLQVKLWRLGSIPIASALYVDAGTITNTFAALDASDVRPSIGIALPRILTPVGGISLEWAVPMFPRPVDPPLGRWHFIIALRY